MREVHSEREKSDVNNVPADTSGATPSPAPGPQTGPAPSGSPARTNAGFGRLLVLIYAILALAATVRGIYQLATRGSEAPLAYSLSLLAGIIYIVATIALGRGTGGWRTVAWVACSVELVGVLAVGVATIVDPDAFPDKTVWSSFGQGYGYVPLVLPLVGLFWLWRTRPHALASLSSDTTAS